MIATNEASACEQHALAAGSLCRGDDGTCDACGVAMVECCTCGGIGYHRPACAECE